MYPGKEGSDLNHKKAYCTDGARQKAQEVEQKINGLTVKVVDQPPPYPQPSGIFTSGTHFHPMRFLQEVGSLYGPVVLRKETLGVHDLALATMLRDRSVVVPTSDSNPHLLTLFKLFPSLKLGDCPAHLLVEYENVRYLNMDGYAGDEPVAQGYIGNFPNL